MSDTRRKNIATIDLAKPLQRENCGALLATGDENANRFGAHIVMGGASVDLTGCTVSGSFIRADGVTVPLEGAAEGNTAHVDLTAQCYAVDGVFSLAIKISGEDYAHTIRMVDGYIRRTDTGKYVDSDNTVYSAEDLMAVLKEMDGMENPGSADTMLEGTEMIGADGKKVTGTIGMLDPNAIELGLAYDSGKVTASVVLPHGRYINSPDDITKINMMFIPTKSLYVTPKAESQTFEETNDTLYNRVAVQGDSDLIPENIKAGVSIFGVEGTLEAGVSGGTWRNVAATSLSAYCYQSMTSLVNVEFTTVRTVNERAFSGCRNLESVDFSATTKTSTSSLTGCNKISSKAFNNCYRLKTVIIRNPTIAETFESDAFDNCCHFEGTAKEIYGGEYGDTLIETINPDCAKDGYIYVPSALVADYQTLLPDYATQFRALEDYTVDGTTTGELDETKI